MPTTFPDYALADIDVPTDLGKTFKRSEGGLVITSSRTDPWWRGTMNTRKLNVLGENNEHADFLAWLSWVCDLNMRVDFVHPRHTLPRAYSAETWPMTGNATLEAVPDLRTIVVSDLVVGTILKRGDRLSLLQGDIVVHRWIAEDLIVSSAIGQSLVLTPRLPIGVLAAGAEVVLQNPKMRFMIVPNSWRAPEIGNPSAVSFEVSEALR